LRLPAPHRTIQYLNLSVNRPSLFGRLPIGVKLPLAAGALVLVVGLVMAAAAYIAVRRSSIETADARLVTLTDQLATNYTTSIGLLKARVRAMADQPAISRFLADSSPANRERALAALIPTAPQDSLVMATELRDGGGNVLLAGGRHPGLVARLTRREWIPAFDEHTDSVALGGFRQLADTLVVLPTVAPVTGRPGVYLVQWRRAVTAPVIQQQVARILGSEARMMFGNVDGSLWTDFNTVVPAPPLDPAQVRGLLTFTRPGMDEVRASAVPLPGTPWVFTVGFPTRAVTAPARDFLRTLAGIAAFCLTVGLIAAWIMSRRITTPLHDLADAADAIAGGDHSRRAGLERSDELGRLSRSFDAMAAQVDEARRRLEDKVTARTGELDIALLRLQETQEALVRREKLAVLGQLASGVGHELRNPLGVMSNAVYYLDAVQQDAPEDVRKYLGMLREQISLSAKIVNDLLDFSRITPAERLPIPLEHIAETQLRRLSPPERITVIREFPPTLPLVHVDPVHAGQVVLNLLTNAVQAMAEGGTLHLKGCMSDGKVLLEVSDTGPGVPPEHLEKIFEPLFTTKPTGIGLGLAVSRSLAQANGGDLVCANRPGRGATFAFAMPAAPI
jgi:signal transduction histidine kinase